MQNEYLERTKHYLDNIPSLKPIATNEPIIIKPDSGIKAVVFDIYGTLIISASGDIDKSNATVENLQLALNEGGFSWKKQDNKAVDSKNLLDYFHKTVLRHHSELKKQGNTNPEVDIIKVWNECLDFGIKSQWIEEVEKRNTKLLTVVFELLSNQVYPMPNMKECLNKLFKSNIPIGIVSNAQFYTPLIMNYFIHNEISEAEHIKGFDEDIAVYSYKILRSKPDVHLFELLAQSFKQKYDLVPEQVVFIGNDMLKDVWTAKQMGFKTILFAADQRSLKTRKTDERCTSLKADYVINDLMQIFDIVNI